MVALTNTGSCLCGAVSFRTNGRLRGVVYCHCTQCRKQTGHFMAATSAQRQDFKLIRAAPLRWYRASAQAERGFCSTCGSTLFWRADHGEEISIAAGTLDGPTGLRIEGHIFCADQGDYYHIPDEGYRKAQWE